MNLDFDNVKIPASDDVFVVALLYDKILIVIKKVVIVILHHFARAQ